MDSFFTSNCGRKGVFFEGTNQDPLEKSMKPMKRAQKNTKIRENPWNRHPKKHEKTTKIHENPWNRPPQNTKKTRKSTKIHETLGENHENAWKCVIFKISGRIHFFVNFTKITKSLKFVVVKIREKAVKKTFLIVKSPWKSWNLFFESFRYFSMFLGYREPFQHSSHHLRAVTVLSPGRPEPIAYRSLISETY